MSTYYAYRRVKVMIAHRLMAMDGWKVYGYHEDNSDPMTDYWDPEWWDGIAEKNGYILCVDKPWAEKAQEIRKYNYSGFTYDSSITEKINKLRQMTMERGASEQEEKTAKAAIEKLQKKEEQAAENRNKYVVVGVIPAHMENPPRMNWHIEKDGIIVAKGNGLLKFDGIERIFSRKDDIEEMNLLRKDKEKCRSNYMEKLRLRNPNISEKDIVLSADYYISKLEEYDKLSRQFNALINKIDTTCGGLIGEGDGTYYEKVKVTEYKKELKPVETKSGEIKEGQCFILKTSFTQNRKKGLVYRIHETEMNGKKYYSANKLNGKYTKECTGTASANNHWFLGSNTDTRFIGWIQQGAITWCELQEVSVPHEVEKVVKRTVKRKAC